MLPGLSVHALPCQCMGEIGFTSRVLRVERDRALVVRRSLIPIFLVAPRESETEFRLRERWLARDGFLKARNCFVHAASIVQSLAVIELRLRVFRKHFGHLLETLQRRHDSSDELRG